MSNTIQVNGDYRPYPTYQPPVTGQPQPGDPISLGLGDTTDVIDAPYAFDAGFVGDAPKDVNEARALGQKIRDLLRESPDSIANLRPDRTLALFR
jgi:hypothetical protein